MKRITFLCFVIAVLLASSASAEKLCIRKVAKVKNGRVKLSPTLRVLSACPNGFLEILDTETFRGPAGTNGVDGADGANGSPGADGVDGADGIDGALAVYGDGSAGDLVISSNTALSSDSLDLQYDNITINSGVTWTVPSGTFLRCTGSITINGTLRVSNGSPGGSIFAPSGYDYQEQPLTVAVPPHPGVGVTSALFGNIALGTNYDTNQESGTQGIGASGIFQIGALIRHTPWGGGGGGGSVGSPGGDGGGRVTVLCQGAISISGSGVISAIGEGASGLGAGGGGGGIVVLASATSVSSSGLIIVNGGDGGAGDGGKAPGGGGGGGLIAVISPSVSLPGSELTQGGLGASASTNVNTTPRQAGGNGGGSYGNGGRGGHIPMGGSVMPGSGSDGSSGAVVTQSSDPTALFM